MSHIRKRISGIKIICLFSGALIICATWSSARTQTPEQDGLWSAPFALPLIAIHSAMLPTGKVLLFSAEHGVPGVHGWLLDPITLELTNVAPPNGWNPDCAGHSFLADGRLLVAGGTLQFNPLLGSKLAFIFDPFTEEWLQVGDMANGRWYPTNLTLPDGRIVTMSGLNDSDGELNLDIEIWDPSSNENWQRVGQRSIPYYPYLHVMPSGLVFRSGPDPQTETFDPVTSRWTPIATMNFSGRFEAPSILLPPTLNRIMVIGGYAGSGLPTNSAEIIDFSDAAPKWRTTAHMQFPRLEHNATLLPDGKVLVVGGRTMSGETRNPADAVLIPELFDPTTESWRQVAPHQVPRMYHSTAILLPDGRVLVAGADFQPSGEIYSPPYLFRGNRPVIQTAPDEIMYGTTFNLMFTSSTNSNTVALIRLSSVTHSVNMGQRCVRLAEISSGSSAATIPAPANANLAPPGFYMLFVVNEDGVPSVSRIVQVKNAGLPTHVDEEAADRFNFQLSQNYPNPFNPTTQITYRLPNKEDVVLRIYNSLGQEIITLTNEAQTPGMKSMTWDGKDKLGRKVSSGIYFYALRSGNEVEMRKMLLIR